MLALCWIGSVQNCDISCLDISSPVWNSFFFVFGLLVSRFLSQQILDTSWRARRILSSEVTNMKKDFNDNEEVKCVVCFTVKLSPSFWQCMSHEQILGVCYHKSWPVLHTLENFDSLKGKLYKFFKGEQGSTTGAWSSLILSRHSTVFLLVSSLHDTLSSLYLSRSFRKPAVECLMRGVFPKERMIYLLLTKPETYHFFPSCNIFEDT